MLSHHDDYLCEPFLQGCLEQFLGDWKYWIVFGVLLLSAVKIVPIIYDILWMKLEE